jgi:hypothetical protein
MNWADLFKPTRYKLKVVAIIPIAWFLLGLLLGLTDLSWYLNRPANHYPIILQMIAITYLILAIYSYPLACYIDHLVDRCIMEGSTIMTLRRTLVFIILVVVFSPGVLYWIVALVT